MTKISTAIILTSILCLSQTNSKEVEVSIDKSVSGAVITLANILEEKMKKSSAEDQRKYEKFKEKLNEKLNRDFINQKIYFKTNNSNIDESIKNYLTNMIISLDNYQDLNYNLEGYTDARGEESDNLKLSEKRMKSVKNILLSLNIPEEKITFNNYGESKSSLKLDIEDYFFDRKVEITIKK